MRHGSLFSGIGGFDLAAEWMGWHNVFHCEWMPFPRQVLHHYWPNAISYEDITKTDFTIHRGEIDILTGGFPCQPYSSAGKRLGKDDERHLWPEMLRAIREIEPTYIVGENVRGLTNWNGGVVFEEVCTDLESCGYEVQPLLLPAVAVNAPHRRDRVWFVAYSDSNSKGTSGKSSGTESNRSENYTQSEQGRGKTQQHIGCSDVSWNASDTDYEGLQGKQNQGDYREKKGIGKTNGRRNTSGILCSIWEEFPTQSPICGGDDGIPRELDGITFSKWRNESIKGYGNAIVPQVVYQIFKAIEQYDNQRTIPSSTGDSR